MTMRTFIISLTAMLVLAAPAGAATIKSQNVTQGGPFAVAPTTDGSAVFVGARDCAYVGRFDLVARTFGSTVAQGGSLGCSSDNGIFSMVQGLDGKLYFTLYGDNKIGRVNADGTGLQTIAADGIHPLDITIGPDGKIWFTLNGPPGRVGRVDPATFTLVETPVKVPGDVQGPRGIISGPDGNLYVPGGEADTLWKVVPGSPPTITVAPNAGAMDGPSFGEVGPDGRIWFTLFEGKGVRTYNPSAGGGSTIPLSSEAWDVAFGEDGKGYATLYNENKVAQIDRGTSGDLGATVITPLTLPGSVDSVPAFIAASPSGNLFAAGRSANALFEITPDVPPRTATSVASGVTANAATVAANVNPRGSATAVRILYGTSPSFGQTTPDTSLAAVDEPQGVGFSLAGLAPETTYYYRAEASNKYGTTVGVVRTFVTAQAPDADGDGARPPADCDDTKATVKPGGVEVIGDGIDQDCKDGDLRVVAASVRNQWRVSRGRTRVTTLTVLGLTGAATIELRCTGKGCPFKKKTKRVSRATARVTLASLFKKRALRAKTVIEVRVSMPGFATKVVRYTTRSRKVPTVRKLCLAPGATKPAACAGA